MTRRPNTEAILHVGDPKQAEERVAMAYELIARAYDQCRRVAAHQRWNEGDADDIASPLSHSRRRARRLQAGEPEPAKPDDGKPDPIGPRDGEADGS